MNRRLLVAVSSLAMLTVVAHSARCQYQTRPWLPWRTVQTEHFSVHYPTELEAWARSVASKMEGVDSVVSRIVGYTPRHRVQIVVDDPYRISNGSAWPFLNEPALVLWATPPSPREDIGTYLSWADMLASHEFGHLAHLTRPSRNVALQSLWDLLPVELGPIGRKVPRWVVEGYATYVEGIVTGSGRPNGAWRPTILRQWAIEGRLPSYPQLSSAGGMYGDDFAYLGGSAFIEWLAARQGDSSLVALWRRLTAKTDRGFDEAFAGVYGEAPAILYGRFASELTGNALEVKRALADAPPDSGHPIQHLMGETGDPAISADGGRVAILLNLGTKPGRVVIWSTIPEPDTAVERERRELLFRDPQDVAPIRVFPPAKKAISTLLAVASQPYKGPRFFRDGRVLVWRNAAVGDGSYAPDLFIWDPQRHTVRRLTHAANVREADPAPDASSAVGLRCGGGHCDLVLIDVRSGAVRLLAKGSETRSFYRPRYSPDGRSILACLHDGGRWQLATISVADGTVKPIAVDGNAYDASFADDSTIVATIELNRIPTVARLSLRDGAVRPLAHVTGAAVGADFNPADRSVWFLALHSRGWDLRSAPIDPAIPMSVAMAPYGAQNQGNLAMPRELASGPVGASHRYRLGPRKWIYVPGTAWSDEGASLIMALVNSDIVGRRELLFQWQGGSDESWQGTSLALTSRASRIPWTAAGFMVRQNGDAPISTVLHGGAFSLEASRRVETSLRRLTLGGTVSDLQTSAAADGLRELAFATLTAGGTHYGDGTRTAIQLSGSEVAGRSGGASVQRGTISATIEAGLNPVVITGTAGRAVTSSRFEQFTIGGLPPVLLHPSVLSQRITMPVLPTAYATGQTLVMYRASVPLATLRLYIWGARVGSDSTAKWQVVRGIEWSGSIPEIAAIGTPTARVTAGIGNWTNGPHQATPLVVGSSLYDLRQRSLTQLYIMTQFGDWAH